MAKRPVTFLRRPNPNLKPDDPENACWVYGPKGLQRCPCVRSEATGYGRASLCVAAWKCTVDGHMAPTFRELEANCPFNTNPK